MNALINFYQSSIGKKIIMSLTGLFLCSFLLEHVVGNLIIVIADAHAFNEYSEFMAHNIIVRTIEFGLFFTLVFHPFVGLLLWVKNRRSRPRAYAEYKLQENTELASRFTMLTGSIIFLFLVVHLRTFFIPLRFSGTVLSPAVLVEEAFSNWKYAAWYVFALIVLGYHLRHGFQSAFQSLGLRNKKYTPLIDAIAVVFWLLIPLGYAVIPIYFQFFYHAAGPMAAGVQ